MVVAAGQAGSTEVAQASKEQRESGYTDQQLSIPDVDPAELAPLCDEEEFAAILEGMVADEAPRVFAIVQEYGVRADGRIAAWGMAFEDHALVSSVDGSAQFSLQSPERALRIFARAKHVSARVVWFNPDAATPLDDEDDLDDGPFDDDPA